MDYMHRLQTTIDGVTISYVEHGQGPTILFLHGGGTEASTNARLILDLGQQYRVIAPDIPFFGKSGILKSIKRFEDYSDLFGSFLDKLGVTDVVVIGYSFGGGIAARMHTNPNIKNILLFSPAIMNLHINVQKLTKLILKEFYSSLMTVSSIDEFTQLMLIVYDFLKNVIMCKEKNKLVEFVMRNLNQDFSTKGIQKITTVLSKDDPIFFLGQYKDLIDMHTVKQFDGAHLRFMLKKDTAKTIQNLISTVSGSAQ